MSFKSFLSVSVISSLVSMSGFSQGSNNCEYMSQFHGQGGVAFCGKHFGETGDVSIALCVPVDGGRYRVSELFIRGNLGEQENYNNCTEAAYQWNDRHVFRRVAAPPTLPFPQGGDLQCVKAEKERYVKLTFHGDQVGKLITFNQCIAIIEARTNNYACVGLGEGDFANYFSILSLEDGEALEPDRRRGGGSATRWLSACLDGMQFSKNGKVCSPTPNGTYGHYWHLYGSDGTLISPNYVELNACLYDRYH